MENKIIVITGGASGIGFAIAKQLISKNIIISIDRNPEKIAKLTSALPKVVSIKGDVTSDEDLTAAISQIEKQYKHIDILINNAGKGFLFSFAKMSEEQLMQGIKAEIEVNYYAPISLTKKALPLLQKSSQPIVAFVSSGLAYMPVARTGSYSATKSAIHFIAMSLRKQLKKQNIKVVEILPPVVETDMSKEVTIKVNKMDVDKFAKIVVLKLEKGDLVMNIGQTAMLEKFSRFFPKMAFKALNR